MEVVAGVDVDVEVDVGVDIGVAAEVDVEVESWCVDYGCLLEGGGIWLL